MVTQTSERKMLLPKPTAKQDGSLQKVPKKMSFLPGIIVVELIYTVLWIQSGQSQGIITSHPDYAILMAVPILQALWTLLIVRWGHQQDWFAQDRVLNTLPMIWLPLFPIVVQTSVFFYQWQVVGPLLESSLQSLVALQGIRALAVGTLLKWRKGVFPTAFAWGTAFPDMLFGLSAWVVAMHSKDLPWIVVAGWNAFGLLLIVPVGVGIVQLGMTPTRLYHSVVPYKLVFKYPMVLGPAVAVPILLSWNSLLLALALSKLSKIT